MRAHSVASWRINKQKGDGRRFVGSHVALVQVVGVRVNREAKRVTDAHRSQACKRMRARSVANGSVDKQAFVRQKGDGGLSLGPTSPRHRLLL
jgi:hypothetical protein